MLPALAVQLAAVLLLPETVSVNCLVPPELTVAVVGEMETATDCAGGCTVTVEVADLVGSATLVTVTVIVVVLVTDGAVKRPPVEMLPALAVQLAAVLLLPETVSVNCLVPPELTVAVVGEMETATDCAGGCTVTVADADLVGSATLVTFTVIVVVLVTEGAVKRPVVETLPALAVQLTAVLVLPVTVSVNCLVPAELTVAVVGEILIETVCAGG